MVRTVSSAQVEAMLTPESATLHEAVPPRANQITDSLGLLDKPNLELRVHRFFSPADASGLSPTTKRIARSPIVRHTFPHPTQPAWLEPTLSIIELTSTRTTDSSYSSAPSSHSSLSDNSCPPPPRASIVMCPQSQALLDKKLRKMGGWRSRFLNIPPSTVSNPRRSTMKKVLDFVREDLILRRSESGRTSRASSCSIATPPSMSPIGARFTN
ncbi:unnamed protein product [Rhizoctonia solani]|uniref:Uncharacterized protein n=1 Tax=Rhizoctonia solani TaxID=456999 RepID=A0A8H2WZ86_9AGAM|nr:unnamed protein product [Rhizoctonia solani]